MIYKPDTLCIIYTYKCNIECKHCCFSCSSLRNEKINFDSIISILNEAKKIASIKNISFSGGEVFLFWDEILELIKVCKRNSFNVSCTTNGSWGRDYEDAKNKLRNLKRNGLDKLIISYDKFHSEFVKADVIRNIIRLCNIMNIEVEINSVITNNINEDLGLGEDILEIPVRKIKCMPLGRAKNLDETLFYKKNNIYNFRCASLTKQITIYPDGNIFPCCSMNCTYNKKFLLGNIYNNSLNDCISNMELNENIKNIYKYGLEKYMSDEKLNSDICDVCIRIKSKNF